MWLKVAFRKAKSERVELRHLPSVIQHVTLTTRIILPDWLVDLASKNTGHCPQFPPRMQGLLVETPRSSDKELEELSRR